MRIAREEIFGPVLSVLAYRDEVDAIAIANHTTYGVSACVFGDQARAERIAARLESGRAVINDAAHARKTLLGASPAWRDTSVEWVPSSRPLLAQG